MAARAFITGLEGTTLAPAERAFLRDADPWGLILFRRNVDTPEQVRQLVDEFRAAVGRADAPVLIDQEGGRVQRLGPPHWPKYPPGASYGALYDIDPAAGIEAARLGARLIAADLAAVRHQRRLPAARGCAGGGSQCGDRRSRLRRDAAEGGGDRRGGGGGLDGWRRVAGAQASAWPRPCQCGQPSQPARRRRRSRDAGSDRFPGVPSARELAARDDGARCLHRGRSGRARRPRPRP